MHTPTVLLSVTPSEHAVPVAEHFDTPEQQRESVLFGMWVFLATEIMFFGGAFTAYAVYRYRFSEAFHEASRHLDIVLGAINTVVLLTSSLTMALAVSATAEGDRKRSVRFLLGTIGLGTLFLVIKAFEYHHKYVEHHLPAFGLPFEWPDEHAAGAQLFFSLYLAMTGLHALHMVIGIGLLVIYAVLVQRARNVFAWRDTIENMGLYWHFVDIVWIFLFPLLYLIDRT
jgi:cytochrome c oxidase subunit 3